MKKDLFEEPQEKREIDYSFANNSQENLVKILISAIVIFSLVYLFVR